MAKTTSPAVTSLKDEIHNKLAGRELTPEEFLKIAFGFETVQRIDLFKAGAGTWNLSKIHDFRQGFDPENVTAFIAEKWGDGRYRLSVVMDGAFVAHHTWAIGDPEDVEPIRNRGSREPEESDAPRSSGAPRVINEISGAIREATVIREGREFLNDQNDRALDREMKPMAMMMTMMKDMLEVVRKPQPTNDPMAVVVPMMMKMMEMQQTVFMAMLQQRDDSKGGGIKALAETLSTLEKTLTGRIGEMLGESREGGMDWAGVMTAAAPMLERGIGVLEAMVSKGAGQQRALPPSGTTPRPNPPTTVNAQQGGEKMPVRLHPDDDMNVALIEAVKMGAEMLKSRDFKSLTKILEINMPDFLEQLDFDVQPLVYIQFLKRIEPSYDTLRVEFADFMKYLEAESDAAEKEAAEKPEPEGSMLGRPDPNQAP